MSRFAAAAAASTGAGRAYNHPTCVLLLVPVVYEVVQVESHAYNDPPAS